MGGSSRLSIILAVLILLGAAAGKFFEGAGDLQLRRPDIKAPGTADTGRRRALPSQPRPNLPEGFIGRRKSVAKATAGTAFTIDTSGRWMTAKHVVDHCSQIALLGKQPRRGEVFRAGNLSFHPHADVAILTAKGSEASRQPFHFAENAIGIRDAFHVGYPQGKPSGVHSQYLGAKRVRHQGSSGQGEIVRVWAERHRFPNFSGSLGGMSGGPVFNKTGAVIGVSIAENPRRGRIMTSTPRTLFETTRLSGREVLPSGSTTSSRGNLTPQNFSKYAQSLLNSKRVARVICKVDNG